jgi:hypothetical protein
MDRKEGGTTTLSVLGRDGTPGDQLAPLSLILLTSNSIMY